MRNFGGGSDSRNEKNREVLNLVRLAFRDSIKVAGFTEITNDAASREILQQLIDQLIQQPIGGNKSQNLIIVNCGRTAGDKTEFTAIGVNSSLQILEVGRVYLYDKQTLRDVAPVDRSKFAQWCNTFPTASSLDYRALVYVKVCETGKAPVYVGFVHNMYTLGDNRITFMLRLPKMIDMIRDQFDGNIYIGGDFNTEPVDRKGKNNYYCYVAGLLISPKPGIVAFTPGGTLMSGNKYDYWYSNLERTDRSRTPNPKVTELTLRDDVGLSDHCGILLNIKDI